VTQIQGGLSASTDEIAWVQTAYLIADVVMVPMSGSPAAADQRSPAA
jgi:DHA2 family multidrug resistance protein